jgi:hypothetical protein
MFLLDEAWFTLNGNVIGENNRYWYSKNPHAVFHKVFLHGLEVGVCCAVSACKTTGLVFFKEAPNNLWIVAS